ncbi:MAG: SDR family NAD(P)-dependent oxidoreductase [Candidatus Dojkabacteria bacterium]
MDFKPESKIALVTGSSKGIGRAIALELAKEGFDLFIHFNKSKSDAYQVSREVRTLGRNSIVIQADVSDDKAVADMFKKIEEYTDKLDLVVNNAGFDYGKLIEEYTLKEMRYVIDVVLFSKLSVTKYALPLLKNSPDPRIVNIASRMGKEKTIPTIGAYGPAAAGVIKFTQASALEFSEYGINVNCVAPGLTDTGLTRSILSDEDFDQAAEANPSGRVGHPDDIAGVVSFLASTKASYINGETIGVNGGSNLG